MKYIIAAACLASNLAMAQAPPIGQGGAAPSPPYVTRGSKQYSAGPTPTFNAACGSDASLVGSDSAGVLYLGTDYQTSNCAVQFAQKWEQEAAAPFRSFVSCAVIVTHYMPVTAYQVYFDATYIYVMGANPSPSGAAPVKMSWICAGTRVPP